jgi:hypothetical protein
MKKGETPEVSLDDGFALQIYYGETVALRAGRTLIATSLPDVVIQKRSLRG